MCRSIACGRMRILFSSTLNEIDTTLHSSAHHRASCLSCNPTPPFHLSFFPSLIPPAVLVCTSVAAFLSRSGRSRQCCALACVSTASKVNLRVKLLLSEGALRPFQTSLQTTSRSRTWQPPPCSASLARQWGCRKRPRPQANCCRCLP